MRNIYDIITEQKATIDVKMASYDLEYTINHFMHNQDNYYLQEGFGEGVKNLAKKIIEFIKSIINKIKELIKKVISFFLGTKSEVQKMEEKIAQAEQGGGSSKSEDKGESEEKSEDKGKSEEKSEDKGESEEKSEDKGESGGSSKSEDNKSSNNSGFASVKLGLNAPKVKKDEKAAERLKKREDARNERQKSKNINNGTITNFTSSTVGKVGSSVDGGLERAFREVKGKMVVKNFPPTDDVLKAFTGFGNTITRYVKDYIEDETPDEYMNATKDFNRRTVTRYCNEATQDIEKMIGGVGRMVKDYVFNAEKVIKEIQTFGKHVEDDLNKIAKETMAKEKDGSLNESISTRLHFSINMLGTFSNKCINLLASGRSHFLQVSWKVTNAYCDKLDKERNN